MTVRDEILDHLKRFIPVHEISDEDDIFRRGFVSSMFAMQLVAFVEQRFDLEVENDDLELDNFRSVAALISFVETKQAAGVA